MVVLIVEPDSSESHALAACVRKQGHTTVATDNAKSALRIVGKEPVGLILLGLNGQVASAVSFVEAVQSSASPTPVIAVSRKASIEDAIELMRVGAHDFWVKPVVPERLMKTIDWIEARSAEPRRQPTPGSARIITQDPTLTEIKLIARRVAPRNAAVFIQGESGTGKELFARYIHQNSDRLERPFVALNCAALPETLIESELFGHEKGAFTGAIKAKEGKFELAHTGTLFLDEITEIPLHLQSKLLRVLQESEVDRVGGKYPVPIDVRVIASTNVNIEEALREGRFRKDLYYRLNVIPLRIPPLRERPEDIALLSRHFIEKYNLLHRCSVEDITPDGLKLLQGYSWPGNVRELENVIQRAMLLTPHTRLTAEYLTFDAEPQTQTSEIELMPIDQMEKLLIHKALASFSGNRTRAAEILGISVRTLRNKLSEYGATGRTPDLES